jgi:hypothetical protein
MANNKNSKQTVQKTDTPVAPTTVTQKAETPAAAPVAVAPAQKGGKKVAAAKTETPAATPVVAAPAVAPAQKGGKKAAAKTETPTATPAPVAATPAAAAPAQKGGKKAAAKTETPSTEVAATPAAAAPKAAAVCATADADSLAVRAYLLALKSGIDHKEAFEHIWNHVSKQYPKMNKYASRKDYLYAVVKEAVERVKCQINFFLDPEDEVLKSICRCVDTFPGSD